MARTTAKLIVICPQIVKNEDCAAAVAGRGK